MDDGRVISIVPNMFSVNSCLFKKYDPVFWAQHKKISPDDLDNFHIKAGLSPVIKARYYKPYDIHILIPWEKIYESTNIKLFYKLVKYFSYNVIQRLIRLLTGSENRLFSSYIIGVYTKN